MRTAIGINGFGRIGRLSLRMALTQGGFDFAGVNDPFMTPEYMAYLFQYDTVHGKYPGTVEHDDTSLLIDGRRIPVYAAQRPCDIPWGEHAPYVIDATGMFLTGDKARGHLEAGAKRVVMSAPAKDDTPMFVYGVNHQSYRPELAIVSNASCTTNGLAPLAMLLDRNYGLRKGLMTTIHSVTATQKLIDGPTKKDWRGGRAGSQNIIPSSTGAAKAVGKVLPQLAGKLTGLSMRVPTLDVSAIDLTVSLDKPTTLAEICQVMKRAAKTELKGVMGYTDAPVVSSDFITSPYACIFDSAACIQLDETFFKLIAWYDNECGYASQLLRLIGHMAEVDRQ